MAAITSREAVREEEHLAEDMDVLEPSGIRRRPAVPRARDESLDLATLFDDGPADARVESFLESVETRRRRSKRAGFVILAVGALAAGVAYLSSIGVVGPDAQTAAASVGTLVTGYFVGTK